ncbi:hypothetical protein CRX72_12535 [Pantoea sp. BRM17]|nr:hypothetical protein CRX72_12535 [Pantoea sp. BRM17]
MTRSPSTRSRIRLLSFSDRQQALSFTRTWAYSDSFNDLPLLAWADHAWAVNPDARLQHEAEQRGCSMRRSSAAGRFAAGRAD